MWVLKSSFLIDYVEVFSFFLVIYYNMVFQIRILLFSICTIKAYQLEIPVGYFFLYLYFYIISVLNLVETINSILELLPCPFILTGDFNTHSQS